MSEYYCGAKDFNCQRAYEGGFSSGYAESGALILAAGMASLVALTALTFLFPGNIVALGF